MRSFEIRDMRPAEFVSKIDHTLVARQYDRYVSIHLKGENLTVEIRWMGTTRFEYGISQMGEGFRAELLDQRIAPLHAPFINRFEGTFEEALAKVGATVAKPSQT